MATSYVGQVYAGMATRLSNLRRTNAPVRNRGNVTPKRGEESTQDPSRFPFSARALVSPRKPQPSKAKTLESTLTFTGTGCQTVGYEGRTRIGSAGPALSGVDDRALPGRSPYNKRTIEAGLWGIGPLGRMQNQQVTCYQCDGVVPNPPFRTIVLIPAYCLRKIGI